LKTGYFFAFFAKNFALFAVKEKFYRKERKAGAKNTKKKPLFSDITKLLIRI
jgi:hypothetical protein